MKEFKFKIGGQDYAATVEDLKDGQMKVTVNGQTYQVEVPQTKAQGPRVAMAPAASAAQTGGTKNVNSELPGTVTKINVADGQHAVVRGGFHPVDPAEDDRDPGNNFPGAERLDDKWMVPFSVLPSLRDRVSIRATCLLRW